MRAITATVGLPRELIAASPGYVESFRLSKTSRPSFPLLARCWDSGKAGSVLVPAPGLAIRFFCPTLFLLTVTPKITIRISLEPPQPELPQTDPISIPERPQIKPRSNPDRRQTEPKPPLTSFFATLLDFLL